MMLALALVLSAGSAWALADPLNVIDGRWETESGETAVIAPCGKDFCVTLETGKYKGRAIGKLAWNGREYKGTVTDPAENKTYAGSATVQGPNLTLKGCVLKVLCKAQSWTRL